MKRYIRATTVWQGIALLSAACFCFSLLVIDLLRVRVTDASLLDLPEPVQRVSVSSFHIMPVLKGLRVDSDDPLTIEFIVDTGDEPQVSRDDAARLISYFYAALTIPEDRLWVNLSPYEQDRIMDDSLSTTDLGKDMLRQDYLLKQLASSLTHPDTPTGEAYWRVENGKSTIENRLGKIWIVPDKAEVYEQGTTAVITGASLKLQCEDEAQQVLLPAITRDVNEGRNFAVLRQMYHAVILAKWFKGRFRGSFYEQYFDRMRVAGIDIDDGSIREKVFRLYSQAFERGVYDLIRKDSGSAGEQPALRRYFAGGVNFVVSSSVSDRLEAPVGEYFDGHAVSVVSSAVPENGIRATQPWKTLSMELNSALDGLGYTGETLELVRMAVSLDPEDHRHEAIIERKWGGYKGLFTALEQAGVLETDARLWMKKRYGITRSGDAGQGGNAAAVEVRDGRGNLFLLRVSLLDKKDSLQQHYQAALNSIRGYLLMRVLAGKGVTVQPFGCGLEWTAQGIPVVYTLMQHGGKTLERAIKEHGALPPVRFASLSQQLVDAVAVMHGYGIPHADLKPANILVTDEGQVLLIDFDLSLPGGYIAVNAGRMYGSLHYMPPEILIHSRDYEDANGVVRYRPSSDMFALAPILYLMLTGEPLLSMERNIGKFMSERVGEYAQPDKVVAKAPEAFRDMFAGMIKRYPGERPDIEELGQALSRANLRMLQEKLKSAKADIKAFERSDEYGHIVRYTKMKKKRDELAARLARKFVPALDQEAERLKDEVKSLRVTVLHSISQYRALTQTVDELTDAIGKGRALARVTTAPVVGPEAAAADRKAEQPALIGLAQGWVYDENGRIVEDKKTASTVLRGGIDLDGVSVNTRGSSTLKPLELPADFAGFSFTIQRMREFDDPQELMAARG